MKMLCEQKMAMHVHVLVCTHDTMRVAGCKQAMSIVYTKQRNCGDGGGAGWGMCGGGGVRRGRGGGRDACVKRMPPG